ncbi:polysaccharide biosynthesis/export family protein [Pontibacter flavimaris]|uniref:Sugar transporter n=1 Tax=Pontibacter flavimaris TaxID=1797110 RepID=A0A1Q5PBH6_9BACT|nr:polysaccharide biosynthesis/export family protein [Pontibacter flavimaris]OKL39564.1 sugar transporter [Pontibacter flavimaris]
MELQRLSRIFFFLIIFSLLSACANTKEAVYFGGSGKAEYNSNFENLEPIIQKNDLLNISVSSLNPQATEIFNVYSAENLRSASASNTIAPVSGYLVDLDGYIQFPLLGKIKAAGVSKKALKEKIEQELFSRKLLLDPIVDIRYLNYKVSVLGEVARPSVITVPNEKLTLLEALGLAGDLTIYANRDNLLLIREEEGQKKLVRLDLTTDEIFTSPYYYLQSNDIIYVEPNKTKIASASAARQWLPLVISSLTLVVVSIDRLVR